MFLILCALIHSAVAGEPDTIASGDWEFSTLFGVKSATTKSVAKRLHNDDGIMHANATPAMLMLICEDGVFKVTLFDMAIAMMGDISYRTEIGFDGQLYEQVNGADIAHKYIKPLMDKSKLYVRWTLPNKEVLMGEFSLKGSTDAIKPAAAACKIPL
jgi:hypothetical protein